MPLWPHTVPAFLGTFSPFYAVVLCISSFLCQVIMRRPHHWNIPHLASVHGQLDIVPARNQKPPSQQPATRPHPHLIRLTQDCAALWGYSTA
ncbi:hypothetical protein C8R44DRAFT_758888 [Mycena epipterygia]|nr:hypothetical protein C8R44DRAFT_758888 [Mycena epipterygia]